MTSFLFGCFDWLKIKSLSSRMVKGQTARLFPWEGGTGYTQFHCQVSQ